MGNNINLFDERSFPSVVIYAACSVLQQTLKFIRIQPPELIVNYLS